MSTPDWLAGYIKDYRSLDLIPHADKDIRDIKACCEIVPCFYGLNITVLAINPEYLPETPFLIPCRGKPLNLATYDVSRDCYCIHCDGYEELGCIPVNYILTIQDAHDWMTYLPVPGKVIRRYLTSEQSQRLQSFNKKYSKCNIQFLQTLRCE